MLTEPKCIYLNVIKFLLIELLQILFLIFHKEVAIVSVV